MRRVSKTSKYNESTAGKKYIGWAKMQSTKEWLQVAMKGPKLKNEEIQ